LSATSSINKDWKFYLGMFFLCLAFILPLFGLLIPLFEFPTAISAILIGLFTLGGPELMMVLAVICLGKKILQIFKKKFCRFFKQKEVVRSRSKFRHYFGLFLLFGSGVPLYLSAYFHDLFPDEGYMRHLVLVGADVVFILSFFILGEDFWENFKNLFIWKNPFPKKKT